MAATFSVNKLDDSADGSCDFTDCSLREAVVAANASPGLDTIELGAGIHQLSLAGAGAGAGDLDLTDSVRILGVDRGSTSIDAAGLDRVFEVHAGAEVTIANLRMSGGLATGENGGAIAVAAGASLLIDACELSSNSADGAVVHGGGIASAGELIVVATTIIGNAAVGDGDGIWNSGGTLQLVNSTLSGDSAIDSQALWSSGKASVIRSTVWDTAGTGIVQAAFAGELLRLENSTVSGFDTAIASLTGGPITLESSTISAPRAVDCPGCTLTLTNTLLVGDCTIGSALSGGGNLESPGDTCGLSPTTDQTGVSAAALALGALADYGGATPTHALLAGSTAIDTAVDTECPHTDQRGAARLTCDVGAFEYWPDTRIITVDSADDSFSNDRCTLRQAIDAANDDVPVGGCATGGGSLDFIELAIPGSGPHTIQPTSPWSTITEPVVLDATQQPGTACAAGTLQVAIDGRNAGPSNGLLLRSTGSTVRGLAIYDVESGGFDGDGIAIIGGGANTVQCNFVGTDVTGSVVPGNGRHGIEVNSSSGNLVGGTAPGDRNVASGNSLFGIYLVNASDNTVQGNTVGADVTGIVDLGNLSRGIQVLEGERNLIGGSVAGAGNLVAHNHIGVYLSGSKGEDHSVVGNRIINNDHQGVVVIRGTSLTLGNRGNCITGNGGEGFWIDSGIVDAKGNWWGHPSGPSGAAAGFGDAVTDGVDTATWLTSPPQDCTTVGAFVDLEITVEESVDPVVRDSGSANLIYTVTVRNHGPDPASGVELSTHTATPQGVGVDPATPDGDWLIGDLAVGDSAIRTTVVNVGPLAEPGIGVISHTARRVAVNETPCEDVDRGAACLGAEEAKESTSITAGSANFTVTKSDGVTRAIPGGQVTYLIEVFNHGSAGAARVVDVFPEDLSCSWTGLAEDGTEVSSGSGDRLDDTLLIPGNSRVTYRAICDIDPGASGMLVNNVSVFDGNQHFTAQDADTLLEPRVDLSIAQSDSPDPIRVDGGEIAYTLKIHNAGPSNATAVEVTNEPPVEASFVSATGDGWACAPPASGTVICTLPELAAGAWAEITVRVAAPETSKVLTNVASVRAAEQSQADMSAERTTVFDEIITVTSLLDTQSDDGHCTLREAILAANANIASGALQGECEAGRGLDVIAFALEGAGPHTLQPLSALPEITAPVVIDGTTQNGTNCATGSLQIELDGSELTNAFVNASGLVLEAGDSTIRGLVINRFQVAGIELREGRTHITLECNFLGTDVTGTLARANSWGIRVRSVGPAAEYHVFGGSSVSARNLISGNTFDGIFSNAQSLVIQGNLIGTDISGTRPLGNGLSGIWLQAAQGDLVGGRSPRSRNLISANGQHGIETYYVRNPEGSLPVTIAGNFIGSNIAGTAALANGDRGIAVTGPDHDGATIIGGNSASAGNLIFGHTAGIELRHPNVTVTRNRVLSNTTGILVVGAGSFDGAENCISRNAVGFDNTTSTAVDVSGNWWGHHTGPGGVAPGLGDSLSGPATAPVEFLEQPPHGCATRGADLKIEVSQPVGQDPLVVGQNQPPSFTVKVTNLDLIAVTGVMVNVSPQLAPGVTVPSDFDSLWTIPSLLPGASESLVINFELDEVTAVDGSVLNLVASLTGADQLLLDPFDDIAAATTEIHVLSDLELTLSGAPDPVEAGAETFVYTATVANLGPTTARQIEVALTPPSAALVAITDAGWDCNHNGDQIVCQLTGSDLPAGETTPSISLEFEAPNDQTVMTVVAEVSSQTRDLNPDNNSVVETLDVVDTMPPTVALDSPVGGEFWLLSDPLGGRSVERVAWTMSDNVRICRLRVTLLASEDQADFAEVDVLLEQGESDCSPPGLVTSNMTYELPESEPSGDPGSRYKVRVEVWDEAGAAAIPAESEKPFFIVPANPDAFDTLILAHPSRLQALGFETAELEAELGVLKNHPLVSGLVVDLGLTPSINTLYAAWDAEEPCSAAGVEPCSANDVLFGHLDESLSPPVEIPGIHDKLLELLAKFKSIEYLVLVGDDRVIPMARMRDRTAVLTESNYPEGDEITPDGTTVGRALAGNHYLSDDPLATKDPLTSADLGASLFLPDLKVGRLVETPEEIVATLGTYFRQQGVLDLTRLDAAAGHKAQVTAYDFLLDSGHVIAERWRNVLSAGTVDGDLLSRHWQEASVPARRAALADNLCAGGDSYAVLSLNGHATHFEEGVPGTDRFDIQGLDAASIDGAICSGDDLDLAGRVVYAVGCHGGLSVPGSDPSDADHSLDLPQTMMRRGVVTYVANSGYGWGLLRGIGYGERLVQLMTEELTTGETVSVGEAVRNAKLRYFLETSRFDPYDEKSVMQWTTFGLPMYALRTGVERVTADSRSFEEPAPDISELPRVEHINGVTVTRSLAENPSKASVPTFLTRLDLHFDFTAPGVYTKRNHLGETQPPTPGCADPEGCYYTLNGVFERGSGESDRPIQPTFIYDSRLRGTSQHGVLWKGGSFDEETGWVPVVGELASNSGDFSNHGSTPRVRRSRPTAPRIVPGEDPPGCRPSDLEINSLVIEAGEVLKEHDTHSTYDIQRLYREIDLEIFYFNNTADAAGNCDRSGPEIADGPHHVLEDGTVSWAVPASDDIDGAAGVWRVVVVWSADHAFAGCRNQWTPLELENDGTGTWRGSLPATGMRRMTYVVQAVDRRGNVTWHDFAAAEPPASGIDPDLPQPVDIDFGIQAAIFADGFETGNTLLWGRCPERP